MSKLLTSIWRTAARRLSTCSSCGVYVRDWRWSRMEHDIKGEATTAGQGVDVEGTIQAVQEGLRSSETNTAISYIERWMQRLHDTGRPELHDIADDLSVLRRLLMTGDLDRVAIGETLE